MLDIDFEDLKCIILYMYQGVIVIPVERKASFLKVRQLFGVAMQGENIAAVSMGFEKSFGNGKALNVLEMISSINSDCLSFARLYLLLEYNESNFDQVTAQNDGSGRISNGPEIIHVQFKKNRQGTDRRHQNRKRMEAKGIAS